MLNNTVLIKLIAFLKRKVTGRSKNVYINAMETELRSVFYYSMFNVQIWLNLANLTDFSLLDFASRLCSIESPRFAFRN